MWDKPAALTVLANALFAVAGAAIVAMVLLLVARLPLFAVREVTVLGSLAHVTRAQVEAVVRGELRGTFFTLSLDASREAFEKLPWVRGVSVRRRWPARLEVELEEHVALARWGDEALIDTHGQIFTAASDERLAVLTGPDTAPREVAEHYVRFRDTLAPLGKEIAAVDLSERGAWRVRLADGMTLELGRAQVLPRLERFTAAYAASVALMREPPTYVDLRYPNGFAVRVRDPKSSANRKA
jgi:cell division protein FtsQ